MPVKDTDRAEFEAFHDLGFDSEGREVLVGLSFEETEWYLDVLERDRTGRGLVTKEEILRRAYLDDRHAAVRLQITEALDEARFNLLWGRRDMTGRLPSSLRIHQVVAIRDLKARISRESA